MDKEAIELACALLDAADAPHTHPIFTGMSTASIASVGYKYEQTVYPRYDMGGGNSSIGWGVTKQCYKLFFEDRRFIFTRNANGDIVPVDSGHYTYPEV